jgi:formate dehydrogenase subunit gamma
LKQQTTASRIPEPVLPTSYDSGRVAEVLDRWRDIPGNLMPVLHEVQEALGYVPPDAVPQIARALNQSRAEVHGVISFYHDFRTTPPGRRILKVCQAESCQAMSSRELTAALEARLGCALGETTADGEVTVEPVYCLGLCACSPAVLIDNEPLGRATADAVLARLAREKEASS